MTTQKQLGRRAFLGQAGRGAAALIGMPYIVPSGVLAQPGRPGANDRIGVGYIGVGRRAMQLMHLPEGAEIVAYADVYQARLDKLKTKNPKAAIYRDYHELLASKDVDAVVVATPDHWHALPSVHACEAGKDVYCEKPLSLTVREGRRMADAARKHGRVFQTGSQQRSTENNRLACAMIREGKFGKVLKVHGANYPSPWECDLPEQPVPEGLDWDRWCGPTEPRPFHIDLFLPRADGRLDAQGRPLGWISFRPYSGGEMTGWGPHGLDQIQWALGMDAAGPVEVWPEGPGLTAPVTFRYANDIHVYLDGEGPGGGAVFECEAGKVRVDRGKFEVLPKGLVDVPRPSIAEDHMANWIECIRTRATPNSDVEIGHRTCTMCHLGNIARWTGRRLRWDPAAETFPDDPEANALLERPMRAPYAFS